MQLTSPLLLRSRVLSADKQFPTKVRGDCRHTDQMIILEHTTTVGAAKLVEHEYIEKWNPYHTG